MNILVVGCGKVGSRLAHNLSQSGHDVSIVDRLDSSFDLIPDDFSGLTTAGVPIDQDVLKKAGIESCDALAAVSQDDNVNIMVSELAREIFHVPHVLARIYDPSREDVFSHFGLHTVCPTNLTVEAIRSALLEHQATRNIFLGSHSISFRKIPVPKEFLNCYCDEITMAPDEVLFAIERVDLSIEFVAKSHFRLSAMDKLIVASLID